MLGNGFFLVFLSASLLFCLQSYELFFDSFSVSADAVDLELEGAESPEADFDGKPSGDSDFVKDRFLGMLTDKP